MDSSQGDKNPTETVYECEGSELMGLDLNSAYISVYFL